MHFDPITKVRDLSNGAQDATLSLYLFDSIFRGLVWIDKPHDLKKEFFPNNGCHDNIKNTTFYLSQQRLLRGKNVSSKTCI